MESLHHPKLQLNIFNIFSHARRVSRLKPDNEKRQATNFFLQVRKKHKYFLQKNTTFSSVLSILKEG